MRNWIIATEAYISADIPDMIYHGTSLRSLIGIIGKDLIYASEDDHGGLGIFCSGDIEVSKRYVGDASYGGSLGGGGVIILNSSKILAAGYKISPYEYYEGDDGVEYVIDPGHLDLKPASVFITSILMCSSDYQKAKSALTSGENSHYIEDEWDDKSDYQEAVKKFLSYPFEITS